MRSAGLSRSPAGRSCTSLACLRVRPGGCLPWPTRCRCRKVVPERADIVAARLRLHPVSWSWWLPAAVRGVRREQVRSSPSSAPAGHSGCTRQRGAHGRVRVAKLTPGFAWVPWSRTWMTARTTAQTMARTQVRTRCDAGGVVVTPAARVRPPGRCGGGRARPAAAAARHGQGDGDAGGDAEQRTVGRRKRWAVGRPPLGGAACARTVV